MKLIAYGETYQAEKITKSDLNIIGYDINNNEIFSFKGISDFTEFQLQDDLGNSIDFPLPEPTDAERIAELEEIIDIMLGGIE